MFEGRINKIIIFLIYISIFVNSYEFAREPVEIYLGYVVFVFLLPFFILRHSVPQYFWIIFFLLFVAGIANIIFGNDTSAQFFKIFFGVFFSYLFYYYVVVQFDYNVEKLFQLYLKGCFIVAVIGVIQFISYKIGFVPGYNYGWLLNKWGVPVGGNFGIRINSVFGEPTYFAACVSSGAFVSMYNLLVKRSYYLSKLQSAVILIAFLLSFSGVAYYAFFIAIIILLINFGFVRYVLIFVPVLIGIFSYLYTNVSEFRERYDSTIDIFLTGKFTIGKTHGSSIILYNNYHVAMENFSTNFLFGTGLGWHPVAFEKYSITKDITVYGFNLNGQDASSMLLRLISETGIFGTGLMLMITFGCFVRRRDDPDIPEYFWIISGAILTMILANLLRQGHYFLNGFPFFIWLYYYNRINFKKFISEKEAQQKASSPTLLVNTE